jgi:multidrug efflux pump subunit AcrA (membrane-fusion protein)
MTSPSAAIRRSTTGTFVYAVSEENRASVRPVSVLMQEEAYSIIGDGVGIGSRVIKARFDQLKDGKPVRAGLTSRCGRKRVRRWFFVSSHQGDALPPGTSCCLA